MGVYWGPAYCPKCKENTATGMDIHRLWNPHPDAYDTRYRGRTLRQLGVSGRGEWHTHHCEKCGHVWAVLKERY
jgi:hypothetical protein